MKKPTIEKFASALASTGGNLTQTASILGVSRSIIHKWVAEDADFKAALSDSRGKMLDECIAMSRIVALGIPEKAPDGKIVGWISAPDSAMLRYLLGTLGCNEGFGDQTKVHVKATVDNQYRPRDLSPEEAREYLKLLNEEY